MVACARNALASTGASLISRTRALAAAAARAMLSIAAFMSSLAGAHGWSRSTPMRGEDDVGDRGCEQSRGVEMPRHAFHADARQQPVRRLEAGDLAIS